MNRRHLLRLLPIAGLVALAGCGTSTAPALPSRAAQAPDRGVLDIARANDLNAFLRAVETAGLTDELSGNGPFTLFVPSDAAFRAARVSPTGDRETLRRLLAFHVVPGHVDSSFMAGLDMNHLTSAGQILNVDGRSGGIRVGGANLVRRDLQAANGVVHVVDRVLRPA
jgi:uncharacterized surface protein with fasciclin (FAS1) repeats